MWVRIQDRAFDPGAESNAFSANNDEAGAFVTFTGRVRSTADNPVTALVLEHHPTMATKQIERFAQEAQNKFNLASVAVIHRYGKLLTGEPIVQVMASAPHRHDAFDGACYVMDWLKTDAPFWKKEVTGDGTAWVEHRLSDETAKKRWI